MGKVTHTLMNGGTLQILNIDDFHRRYMERAISGEKQYLVELKTDPFKFYIDFDYKDDYPLEDSVALGMFKAWEQAVPGPVYVAKSPARVVDGLWKSGFHLVWPERTVTKGVYTRLRNSIVLKTPDVADFIDSPTSGLRMLWSHKFPVGKPYVPWVKIQKGGFISILDQNPNVQMLNMFSIRAPENTETEDTTSSGSVDALENFIRKHVRGHSACNVKKLLRKGTDIVVQTDSTYCENLGDHHRSNHIWFLIRGGKLFQKCHCKCDVVRKKGKKCKDFTGTPYVIPQSVLEDLHPESDSEEEQIVDVMRLF